MMFPTVDPNAPTYDPAAVEPMRNELNQVGFQQIESPEQVDEIFATKDGKSTLMVINSVCGCAAGNARPGVALALQNEHIPSRLLTSFAGNDKSAVNRFREHLSNVPPSSPMIAVIRNGEPVRVLERRHIEGRSAQEVAQDLVEAFNANPDASGPSIPPEEFEQLEVYRRCGRSIPRFNG